MPDAAIFISLNAIGEPVLPPTPLSPDFDPLASSRSSRPRHLVSAARYVRAARRRRQVSRVARLGRPEGPPNSAVSLRPDRPQTFLASLAPRKRPESLLPLRDRLGRFIRRLAVRGSLRPNHPKALPASRSAPPRSPEGDPNLAPVQRSARKPTDLPVRSSGPGAIIRRVSASRPPAASPGGTPKHPSARLRAIGANPTMPLARRCRAQRGPMSHPPYRSAALRRFAIRRIKPLNTLPVSRRTVMVSMS